MHSAEKPTIPHSTMKTNGNIIECCNSTRGRHILANKCVLAPRTSVTTSHVTCFGLIDFIKDVETHARPFLHYILQYASLNCWKGVRQVTKIKVGQLNKNQKLL